MVANSIEHRGVVRCVEGGKAVVAMEAAGCASCRHGTACGIGRMAGGRATLLTLPAGGGIAPGDRVIIALPESRLTVSALLGYLFPALSMLVGAGFGASLDGSDEATALGAIVGFFGALGIARLALWTVPGLLPAPQLIPAPGHSHLSQEEFHHERSDDQ
ncbi:MAG: SoxR reducing system RseC family protein [Betaproteobacteria bacterium]|nr:SoxR reducing system RseC family protein [Betaproteobacteria bacterium]